MPGQDGAHRVEATGHVECDDLVELGAGSFPAGLAHRAGAAGDVDQNVDFVEGGDGLVHHGLAAGGVGQVTRRDHHAAAHGAGGFGDWFDGADVAAGQDQVAALTGESQGDGGAHAFCRAGDQGDFVLQVQIHIRPAWSS